MSSSLHLLLGSLSPGAYDFLVPILNTQNYAVTIVESREAFLSALQLPLDLIILDLPSLEELPLLTEVRAMLTHPIIVIGPHRNDHLLIAALEQGADDFIARPFHTNELLARVRAQLRRRQINQPRTFQVGKLQMSLQSREALLHGQALDLTANEFDLLMVLAAQPGQPCPPSYLLTQVWGSRFSLDFERLQVTVHNLRQRIEGDPTNPRLLCGDLKRGYWLCNDGE